jgi:hypothetical protein
MIHCYFLCFFLQHFIPPTHPLRPIKTSNTRSSRITAAAGTELAGTSYLNTVIICFNERALQPLRCLHSHNIAGSSFRSLSNIPHCCLHMKFGRYLNPNVAVLLLKSATDHWLDVFCIINYLISNELI